MGRCPRGIKIGIRIVASETPRRYDRFVSLAGGQAEIAPGANPGSKIRGFGSSKHLDEGHQSRARASLRAGTSRLTERGEKGGKNDEMTRDESRADPWRPRRPRRGTARVSPAGVFARAQVHRGNLYPATFLDTSVKLIFPFRGKRFFVELSKSDKARIRLRGIAISLTKDLAV
ncbi:hypothetical protein ALC57_08015 [Trachymyrmex cornetzi]|uniref:Uncharacterized protein n=1 Tax=Trachymyrmex cornetzi TaxID=471704 RepID=A0A195E3U4_9HYME|nr:hypothetical protein ALC57_08015 [Trachymyrmex cornetzi]